MLGCRSGFQALVKTVVPNGTGTHCVIHRQVLSVRSLPPCLKLIMPPVIQAINFNKSNTLNSTISNKLFPNGRQINTAVTSYIGQMVIQRQS
jgi:hypothetical protein